MARRFPNSVFGAGEEPDPRFSLANERTFLAWMRTALALALAGVALEALDAPIFASMRLAAALIFVSLGLLAAVHSWWAWAATEKSLRVGRPLPGMAVGALVAVGASVACVLVIVGSLIP